MYHSIISPNNNPDLFSTEDPIYTITVEMFEKQMQYLYKHNFLVLTLDDIFHQKTNLSAMGRELSTDKLPNNPMTKSLNDKMRQLRNNPTAVILTFDDGHISNYTAAFPILKKYGFKAEFFLIVNWIGRKDYLNWDQIKEMADEGMSFQSHTMSHRFLHCLSTSEIIYELKKSKDILEENLGKKISYLSLPGGRYNKEVIKIAKQVGYKKVLTSIPGWNNIAQNAFLLKRFAIKNITDFETFIGIIERKFSSYLKQVIPFAITSGLRKIVGEQKYEKIRNVLSGIYLGRKN